MADVQLNEVSCWCGLPFAIPHPLYRQWRENGETIHCPLGHRTVRKQSECDKLRLERDRLRQQIAYQQERTERAERSAAAYSGHVTRLKKRASAGVCPCCNRTFQQLARHMKTKHPEYAVEEKAA